MQVVPALQLPEYAPEAVVAAHAFRPEASHTERIGAVAARRRLRLAWPHLQQANFALNQLKWLAGPSVPPLAEELRRDTWTSLRQTPANVYLATFRTINSGSCRAGGKG